MRILTMSWIIGGVFGALAISWLAPIAAMPFLAQASMLLGGNIAISLVVELILIGFLGVKK